MKSNIIFSLLIVLVAFACKQEQQSNTQTLDLIEVRGKTMGTTYSVKYYGDENYHNQIDSVLLDVNQSLSTYIPTSIISRINQAEKEAKIDKHFVANMLEATSIYNSTNGAFNPAVMPLVNYYGFGFENHQSNKIDTLQVKELLKLTDFKQFEMGKEAITKQQPKAQLDFSALAKGYGVDQVGLFLTKNGIQSYLVEIGGETLAYGKKENGKLWTVGIRKPSTNTKERKIVQQAITLNNEAMATSGNYENYKPITGGTISHTINPKTGFPQQVEEQILSSTVIANTCMRADGFATAFKVMGLEESKKVLQGIDDLKVFFIYVDENNKVQTWSNFNVQAR